MTSKHLFAALCAAFLLVGCNTIHGVGKDLEKGGQAIAKVAK